MAIQGLEKSFIKKKIIVLSLILIPIFEFVQKFYKNPVLENNDKIGKIIKKIKNYWYLSKDKIEKCKVCEFRNFCIDCREMAQLKSNGDLYAKNPYCLYDPIIGVWKEEKK